MTPTPMTTELEDEAGPTGEIIRDGLLSKIDAWQRSGRLSQDEAAMMRHALRSPAPTGAGGAEKREQVADAIDAARYAHPTHPRDRERPFAEADRGDREYAFRLADAAIAALRRAQPQQQTGASVGEGEASIVNDLDQLYEHGEGVEYGAVMSRVEFDRRVRDKWPIISALLRGRAGDAEGLSEEEREHLRWLKAAGVGSATITTELLAIIDRLTGGKA